jgi:hypothetical protein
MAFIFLASCFFYERNVSLFLFFRQCFSITPSKIVSFFVFSIVGNFRAAKKIFYAPPGVKREEMWTNGNINNNSGNNINGGSSGMIAGGNDEITTLPRQNSSTPANNGSIGASTAAAIAVVDGGEELQALIDEMSKILDLGFNIFLSFSLFYRNARF